MLWYTQAIIVGTLFPSAGAIIYQQQQQQDDRELMIHDGEEILKPSVCTKCDMGNIWWARVKIGL